MGNSSSSLPFSVDEQVGAPHDHNGWALHKGKSTEGTNKEVSVFVGKKPSLSKTPVDRREPHKTQIEPALHHYEYCRKLRHPHILNVYATLDTDNPSSASIGGNSTPQKSQSQQSQSTASRTGTGDLIVVTEPCIPLSEWLLGAAASGRPKSEQLAWGLECVVESLAFLHTSAKLAHGCVSPQSLYVTSSGDVKLWNFSLVTPVGPNTNNYTGGPEGHFLQWESVCCPESYRSPERIEQRWDAISNTGGIHAMDSYSLGVLIGDYWYRDASTNANNVPPTITKAVQRLTTSNIKMRPRLQPLLKCPVFETPYQKLQHSLQEISIQPVERKIQLWQNLGQQLQQQQTDAIPKDVALYKILPLIFTTIRTVCENENLLSQDMYRREVLAMLVPLFVIEEHYQDPEKVCDELSPVVAKLFLVPDRGVRSVLLNQVGFFTQNLNKNALNTSVFEPLCSGFNDSSPILRELTLKATHALVPSLYPPNLEKLSRYLVRLQSDAETSLRTNAVIFIAKIAPHLSEVSKQKMLLPAYVRSMKDPFSPCRLSALKSTMTSKSLFTKKDLATKVMPSVMPMLLDPMKDVRQEAFRVVRELLEDIQQESDRMTELGDPPMLGAPVTSVAGGTPQQTGATATSESTTQRSSVASSSSSGYLSGLSSWMSSSTAASAPSASVKQATSSGAQSTQPTLLNRNSPITSDAPSTQPTPLNPITPLPTPSVDDGWGDGEEDSWDDAEDDNDLAFSNIGGGNQTVQLPTPVNNNTLSMDGFDDDIDDPFASLGMKTSVGVTSRPPGGKKGKLSIPKKAAPAKKLTIDANDVGDGWDDF